ncbi:MAG: nitrite/sulfite reductase [Lentisphaerae bacterium]|nr:nitrite/sulfite reductase [Lentisphaerota bacterium]MCP4102831.1 nitrite/sulfite reductase [Lentisphaerota bacterium]
MNPQYDMLEKHLNDFINEKIKPQELKHTSAPFGIYQQRNGMFMTRIRIPGGHISAKQFRDAADAIEKHQASYAHLSTRQDIQVQDVPVDQVLPLVKELTAHQMPFIGGGGNTFRNIMAPPDSGVSACDVFDVIPYAQRLTRTMYDWEKAFKLPRKLKIGFFASVRDEHLAAIQDLGFIAAMQDGKPGFKVYGGGGMGRESAFGVLLFDWIPESEYIRCAKAITELFYDHGDRNNRMQARIRFIVKRIGKEAFIKLFMEYFEKTVVSEETSSWNYDLNNCSANLKNIASPAPATQEYSTWENMQVYPTSISDEIFSVLLRVPNGNLNSSQMKQIADLADMAGLNFIRLTTEQNLLFPLVQKSILTGFYSYLNEKMNDIDLTLKSFSGNVVSCLGATVCKIGILDSTAMAQKLALRLDELFNGSLPLKEKYAEKILAMIRISGCMNSCSCHPSADIGLQGLKKKGEPHYNLFLRIGDNKFELSVPQEKPLSLDAATEKVIELLKQKFSITS